MLILSTYLKAALLAAAKNDIRAYLNTVAINDRHIVCTDGNRAHIIKHGGDWGHGTVLIPRSAVELALKAKSISLEVTPTTVGPVSYSQAAGVYPDYMRIASGFSQGATSGPLVASLQPDQLRDAVAAVKLVTGSGHLALSFLGGTWRWSDGRIAVVVCPLVPTKNVPSLVSLEAID